MQIYPKLGSYKSFKIVSNIEAYFMEKMVLMNLKNMSVYDQRHKQVAIFRFLSLCLSLSNIMFTDASSR